METLTNNNLAYNMNSALTWGICALHLNKSKSGRPLSRFIHFSLFLMEAVPILGQLISLIDVAVSKVFKLSSCQKPKPHSLSSSFALFVQEFELEILPIYKEHEETFDSIGVHGRMHASRVVIFAEVMAGYLRENQGVQVDIDLLRRVAALHDSGRKANGPDLWESDSAKMIESHLTKKGVDSEIAKSASEMVIHGKDTDLPIEQMLFSSADCIDIMRPCCGHGGIGDFKKGYLLFLNDCKNGSLAAKFRDDLIREAWILFQNQKIVSFLKLTSQTVAIWQGY